MIDSNESESIRPAMKADVGSIYNITQNGVRSEILRERSQEWIEADVENYLVYEIASSIVGCIHQRKYGDGGIVEIGSVYVQPFHQRKGVGKRMVHYVSELAEKNGAHRLFALTTQAANFFRRVCQFKEGGMEDLPPERQKEYLADGRNSRIFYWDI